MRHSSSVLLLLPATLLLLTAILPPAATPLAAQSALTRAELWNPSGLTMERDGLDSLRTRLEEVSRSPAYSEPVRERAQRDAEAIDERLDMGDFRTGDRIVLQVEGEPQIPDTLFVEAGPQVTLPVMGPISLAGVLRSELESHMTKELGRFIQDPVVRARALIRLSVQGTVGAPGFYTVPADIPLGEALMIAGGPSQTSDLERMRIQRRGETYMEGEELEEYIAEGWTLDQLNLRAGDQLVLPQQRANPWWRTPLRYGAVIASSLLLGIRVF